MRFSLRTHHLVVIFLAVAVAFTGLAFVAVDQPASAACSSGSSVVILQPNNTTTATPLSGIVQLKAYSTPTSASSIGFQLMGPVNQSLGEGVQSGTNWTLNWDTRNQPNGGYQVVAIARYGTATTLNCASAPLPLAINNVATQAPALSLAVSPAGWQGPVGGSASFNVQATYVDQYGRSSKVTPTAVNWTSPLGVANPPTAPSTVFQAGTTQGSATLKVMAGYLGVSANAAVPIKVGPPTAPSMTATPAPSPAPSTGTTASPTPTPRLEAGEAQRLANMDTIFRPADPTNTQPIVNLPTLSCMEKAVGAARFAEISGGKSQPTAAERRLAANCFSGSEAIPAVLAPVTPTRLSELATTEDAVTIGAAKPYKVTGEGGKEISAYLISGTGAPNSTVYIYVFSDPLVLRAETNAQGKWEYVLENPLPEGKHEVYAVAEKDAGTFVRTSAVPVQVAAAAPTSSDGSLVVGKGLSTNQWLFIISAVIMVLMAIGLLFTILRRRPKPDAQLTPPPVPAQPAPPAPAPVAPTAPAPAPATPTNPTPPGDPHGPAV